MITERPSWVALCILGKLIFISPNHWHNILQCQFSLWLPKCRFLIGLLHFSLLHIVGYLIHLPFYISLFQLIVLGSISLSYCFLECINHVFWNCLPISIVNTSLCFNLHIFTCASPFSAFLFKRYCHFRHNFGHLVVSASASVSLRCIHLARCAFKSTVWCLAGVIFRCSSGKIGILLLPGLLPNALKREIAWNCNQLFFIHLSRIFLS